MKTGKIVMQVVKHTNGSRSQEFVCTPAEAAELFLNRINNPPDVERDITDETGMVIDTETFADPHDFSKDLVLLLHEVDSATRPKTKAEKIQFWKKPKFEVTFFSRAPLLTVKHFIELVQENKELGI